MNKSNGSLAGYRPVTTDPKGQYVTGKTARVSVASASKVRQVALPTTDATSSFKRLDINGTKHASRYNKESNDTPKRRQDEHYERVSMYGLWASRKYARILANRIAEKRTAEALLNSERKKEPTYQLEPDNVFNHDKVRRIMDEIISDKLKDYTYTPDTAATMSRALTDEIKDAVKELNYARYKIVVYTVISQNIGQDMCVASRCVWDTNFDTSATSTYGNSNVNCSTSVYAVYAD